MTRDLIAQTRRLVTVLADKGEISVPAQFAGRIANAYEELLDRLAAAEAVCEKHANTGTGTFAGVRRTKSGEGSPGGWRRELDRPPLFLALAKADASIPAARANPVGFLRGRDGLRGCNGRLPTPDLVRLADDRTPSAAGAAGLSWKMKLKRCIPQRPAGDPCGLCFLGAGLK